MAETRRVMRVAIFSPNRYAVSETFIRAHIERLPLDTVPIYGGGWNLTTAVGVLWPWARLLGLVLSKISPQLGERARQYLLALTLKRMRVQVVLAEYGTTGVGIHRACVLAHIPFVVYFLGFDASHQPTIDEFLDRYQAMFNDAAMLIGNSKRIQQQLIDWGAPAERTCVTICGADADRYAHAAPGRAQSHFVAIGRFVEKKAPYLTVLAFRDVLTAVPDARLSMVGDGEMLGPTRQLAAALKVDHRVDFLGVRTPDEISKLLITARAFVQHSVVAYDGDSEGTPVAIVEAQMAGLPVVATRHAGIPDVVVDGETGLLVDEGDAVGMAQAMTRLARDPALAERMGVRARERALKRFTLAQHLDELAATLRRAVAEQ